MKIHVSVTVDLSPEQVKLLKRLAESCGHGYDETKAAGRLIRRLLVSKVLDAVAYCHEEIAKE